MIAKLESRRNIGNHYTSRRTRTNYPEGIVTKCITISREAAEKIEEYGILNISGYINDIILWSLQEENYFKHQLIAKFNKIQKELEDIGYEVSISKKGDPKTKMGAITP